jgi:aspartyl-tRNA(Asn)/glutamyl-tRNA(Gln) amidotransferase subunit B
MEEGSLRCDANISLQPATSIVPGTRTEIKNLNSFRAVEKALEYEVQRQAQLLERGEEVKQQTLRWDDDQMKTEPMRSKEQTMDYRYFPEPDLPPLVVEHNIIQQQRAGMPELPLARKSRFVQDYGISAYDAELLTRTRSMADWYVQTVEAGAGPVDAARWLTGEVLKLLNGKDIRDLPFSPNNLAALLVSTRLGEVSGSAAKKILAEMFATGDEPEVIIKRSALAQVSDQEELAKLVMTILCQYPQSAADYLAGKEKALGYLMGQAMERSQGRANPIILRKLLEKKLRE